MWLSIIFALLGAFLNALASLLQRRAGKNAPKDSLFSGRLIKFLLKEPLWLGGIASQLLAFVCAAIALANGELSTVQPIMSTELLFVLGMLYVGFHVPLGLREWIGGLAIALGVSGFLGAARPASGPTTFNTPHWLLVTGIVAICIVAAIIFARLFPKLFRAGVLGFAAGISFAFTAAFTKLSLLQLTLGLSHFILSWQLAVLIAAGVGSFLLAQNAYSAGPLSSSQPAILITGILGSVALGIFLFGDNIQHDIFALAFEVVSGLVLLTGIIMITGSKVIAQNKKLGGNVGYK